MADVVTLSKQGEVAVVTVDSPPVNALSLAVRQGLYDSFKAAAADNSVKAVVLICAGRTFIAGADITEFGKPPQEPWLHAVLDQIEGCPKPVVAAIHGTALGGGLEVALACHYRVAVPTAKCGLPEVLLGLLPGAGGTQRLPRVTGPVKALEMITSGRHISATEAKAAGLVDAIIEGDLKNGAVGFAEKMIAAKAPLRKVRDMDDKVQGVDKSIFAAARKELSKSKRGFLAPQRCIDAVEAACTLPFDEGMTRERELFTTLVTSDQSAAQRHIFFAERAAAKVDDMPKEAKALDVKHGAVLGAGTMGGGIAMNFAAGGVPTWIFDTTQEMLDKGMGIIRKNYAATVEKGRMTQEEMDKRMALIKPTLSYDDFKNADFIIEAVFEEMDIKKEVFKKLDAVAKPGAILATNTSTLDVNEIASVTKRPEAVVGTHFFSPANVMKLLEIVRGKKTSFEVLNTAMAVGKGMGKVSAVVGVCDGFVGNRMFHKYTAEANFLIEEGALPQQVDAALYDWGMAMGPFAVSDLAGIDVGWRIRKRQGRPAGKRYSAIGDKIAEMNRYGQKTGAGFYKYEPGNRVPQPDPLIEKLILDESKALGITRRTFTNEEIIERTIYAMVNEGAKILEEGIAQRASDIDVIYIYGYGFPVFRGGPMFYADTVGLKKVYDKVCAFYEASKKEAANEDRWKPAPLLEKLAKSGGKFNG
jgi:3-hydroxyacyl-CoA dehydrogenase